MKRYVIGDIHGAYKALVQCLQKCDFDYENDQLITLGDICDGWKETIACVNELLKIKNRIDIRGNHDVWYMEFLFDGAAPNIWTSQGGMNTVQDFKDNHDKIDIEVLRNFFEFQQDYYIDDKNNLFVHGGFPKGTQFTDGKFNGYTGDLHWNRTLTEAAMLKTVSLAYKDMKLWFNDFNTIYIGHTALKSVGFKKYQNVWNLDTGAGWNGNLTIMNIDTDEYWMSDLVEDLYGFKHSR